MVSKAEKVTSLAHFFPRTEVVERLGFRQIILLTLGPLNHAISAKEAYTMATNLTNKIPKSFRFDLPTFSVFQNMISKLHRQHVITLEQIPAQNRFAIRLSEVGLGEYDWLVYNISGTPYAGIISSYSNIVSMQATIY
ncbi:MAG: hypothetical protein ACXAD7_23265 [Candidatus Kariarchaeaceae archaeon]|jgi:hypothetical protein